MICKHCPKGDHAKCPNANTEWLWDEKGPTGLSPAAEALQRSGLCACQHKVGANRV